MAVQARSSQSSDVFQGDRAQNGYRDLFRKHASYIRSLLSQQEKSINQALPTERHSCPCKLQARQLSDESRFRLPDVGFDFLFLLLLTIFNLFYDQTGRPVLYDLHVGSVLFLTQMPPGILVSVRGGHATLLGFQIDREAVDAHFGQALVTQSVAPGSLLDHLSCEVSHVALTFPADKFACLVDCSEMATQMVQPAKAFPTSLARVGPLSCMAAQVAFEVCFPLHNMCAVWALESQPGQIIWKAPGCAVRPLAVLEASGSRVYLSVNLCLLFRLGNVAGGIGRRSFCFARLKRNRLRRLRKSQVLGLFKGVLPVFIGQWLLSIPLGRCVVTVLGP